MQSFLVKQKVKKRSFSIVQPQERRNLWNKGLYLASNLGSLIMSESAYQQQSWLKKEINKIAGLRYCLFYRDLPLLFASIGLLLFLLFSAFQGNYDPYNLGGRSNVILPQTSQKLITNTQPLLQGMTSAYQPISLWEYQVQPGDTISELASRFKLHMGTIISVNNIANVRRLRAGTKLQIPSRDGLLRKVQEGETLEGIISQYDVSMNSLLDANNLIDSNIYTGQELFVPNVSLSNRDLKLALGEYFFAPTTGRFTSGFGFRKDPFTGLRQFHSAIDISNKVGTEILASRSGRISYVGEQKNGYGKFIILRHDREFQTLYAHLNKVFVSTGDEVSAREVIGEMGNSGKSTGPHLHFSIIKNGKFVPPLYYIDRSEF